MSKPMATEANDQFSTRRTSPRLVSVVIPVLNGASTIAAQLEALEGQTYAGAWEVIVADNGSTDGTREIVGSWRDRLPALRIVDASARRGINVARNAGLAAAEGEFIAICDSDDICSPGWLEALVAAAPASDIVKGRLEVESLNETGNLAWYNPRPSDLLKPRHGFLPGASASNCGIWADVVEEVGMFNEDYAYGSTGSEFFWRAQLASFRIGVATDAVVHKRYRHDLRGLYRQQFRQGMNHVRLFKEFRVHGMPRSNTRRALRKWARLMLEIPATMRDPSRRGPWLRTLGTRAGRLVGSIRFRVVFL